MMEAPQTDLLLEALIRGKAEEANNLALSVKGLNSQRKAVFDEVEAQGIGRDAFKHMIKVARMDEEKRTKYRLDCNRIAKAFGWEDQMALALDEPAQPQQVDLDDRGINALRAVVDISASPVRLGEGDQDFEAEELPREVAHA